jgi:hypothetical protein
MKLLINPPLRLKIRLLGLKFKEKLKYDCAAMDCHNNCNTLGEL